MSLNVGAEILAIDGSGIASDEWRRTAADLGSLIGII